MAEKFTIKFVNPKTNEYLKELTPIVWTTNDAEALSKEFEVGKVDVGNVKADILNIIEHCLNHTGVLVRTYAFDDFNVDVYSIDLVKVPTGIMVAGKINSAATLSKELLEDLRFITEQVSNEITDIYLRTSTTATMSKVVEDMKSVLGMSKPSMSEDDDEAALCEKISKETKAEIVKPKETLADYQCNDILKGELEEIKDFFENRATYKAANVDLPKGILLKGPPGTGKTYAARCIAGSVNCYFMVCTASALQGMYIGSGAENIRNVFKGAKMLADKSKKGVIVFIDELDSFGSRDNHGGGAGGEEDRTINQLLAEMSGFEDETDIMVLAATNYPERLDDALQRSGRFGRQITINYPDDTERKAIVEQYFGKISLPLSGCDSMVITDLTKGMTPADIKEVANESGILTIRQKKTEITLDNVNEAVNKTITKDTRHPDKLEMLDLVTSHECGHVLAEVLYKNLIPIKVTNYAYGDAGGFTQPSEHLNGIIKKDIYLAEVKSLLAGRAAEEVIHGYITSGASSDLKKSKALIKNYYEIYHFESYDVSKIDQLVLDKIDELYKEVVSDFKHEENLKVLNALIDALKVKRVLYTSDITAITSCLIKLSF